MKHKKKFGCRIMYNSSCLFFSQCLSKDGKIMNEPGIVSEVSIHVFDETEFF